MSSTPLTRDRIVSEAIALLDDEGADALSMRRLGQRLGVSTMSTYHHVTDKSALIEALAERVMSELEVPGVDTAWDDAIRQMARSFMGLTRAHPAVFRVMLAGDRPIALLRTADAVRARLVAGGIEPENALLHFRSFVRFLLGSVMVEAQGRLGGIEVDTTFEHGLELLIAGVATTRP